MMKNIKDVCFKEVESQRGYLQDVSRFYRKVSYYPTWLILKLGLGPNFCSLSFSFSLIISIFAFLNEFYLVGAIFLFVGIMFDYMDGNVARYLKEFKGRPFRKSGKYLDYITHNVIEPFVFFSLLYSFGYEILGLFVIITLLMTEIMRLEYSKLGGGEAKTKPTKQKKASLPIIVLDYPVKLYEQLILVGVILGILEAVSLLIGMIIILRTPLFIITYYKKLTHIH